LELDIKIRYSHKKADAITNTNASEINPIKKIFKLSMKTKEV
jgi:hypothetical protein